MDYNAIAKKYGAISSTPPASTGSKVDYSALAQKFGGSTQTSTPVQAPAPTQDSSGGFLKSLISAPATLLARPVQLGAELLGATPEQVNKVNLGGIIAPVPQNGTDVVKDVGRGVQTVALGTGAPLAGGAAFGFGNALEQQGSDALTTGSGLLNTAAQTGTGLVAGKILDLVGKPLLNAAGKVVGIITPKIVQDVTAKGAGAVADFMAQHELAGGVAKPLSEAITKGAEAFDTGAGKIFKGAGSTIKGAVQSQYPGMTSENVAKHYQDVETSRLMEPIKTPGATFRNATEVANDAQKRGIDLKKLAADNKIYASDHVTDGKFTTQDTVNALRDEAMSGGKDILRPALTAAEPGVQRVPISEIRDGIMERLQKIPDAKLSPEQKLKFAKNVAREYGDGSVTAASHPNGYSLTNLYDSKLQTVSNLYKGPKYGGVQSIADNLTAQQKQIESQVFGDLLKKNAPTELGLDKYFKAQEGRFMLADYLQSLDAKKAPQTMFQRGIKRAAQLSGATTGASVAGPFGMFSGYQFGGMVADTFANASNPVKVAYLQSIGKTEPEIYQIMKDFVSKSEFDKIIRPKLSKPTTIFQGPTQGGQTYTPNTAGFRTTPVVETKSTKLKDIYKK